MNSRITVPQRIACDAVRVAADLIREELFEANYTYPVQLLKVVKQRVEQDFGFDTHFVDLVTDMSQTIVPLVIKHSL